MRWLRAKPWSPYAVGALIGILSWFSFAVADHPIGISTAFVQTVGLAEKAVAPEHVAANPLFAKTKLKIGFEWMLVFGVFVGAFVSALLSGDRRKERVPEFWARRFGPGVGLRYGLAFVGGLVLMFGARLAGG